MKEPRDAYKVLQVDPEADLDVIQAAYRRLAQKYHPDRAATEPDAAAAAVRMVELNAAWDQVRDPARRIAYDRARATGLEPAAGQRPPPPGAGGAPPWGAGTRPTSAGARNADSPVAGGSAGSPGSPGPRTFDQPGSAGPPPGRPSGSVLTFGRYSGWSLGEIGRVDPGYLEWLDRMPIGRPFRAELDPLLRRLGLRSRP